MKSITLKEIRELKPCYDPGKYLKEDWQGTAIDILNLNDVPANDRLWVVLRADFVSERTMRLFAVWYARQVQHLMTDKRSIDALDVSQRFAMGKATQQELDAAWDAADAARAAAWAAAGAARGAAWGARIEKLKEMILAENKE